MPQLVKGGKHVFAWTLVGDDGRIVIPPEALAEYRLHKAGKLIMAPGSRTSGGFSLGAVEMLEKSPLGSVLSAHPKLRQFQLPAGEIVLLGNKPYCWVPLQNGLVVVPPQTMKKYGVNIGDRLLVIRGSGLALGFAVRGPIVAEAEKHPELAIFSLRR
ncbi:hypothetical protein JXO59_13840 [candidate division KSB1 bacterium]|nr:hypothetical protein [candidate division KSB1 bacterium]